MTGQELFKTWAPSDSAWSNWVSPALFAQIACADGAAATGVDIPMPAWHERQANQESAVIVDLPGADSIRMAMTLAKLGYRPVPIINASPGPLGLQLNFLPQHASASTRPMVVLDMNSLVREICIGTQLLQNLSFASDAPPVFVLDALRLCGTNPIHSDMFDNRWMVFPQDFPSARFLAEKKIKRVTLVQAGKAQPLEDLSHVLLRWQDAGIELFATTSGDAHAPSRVTVSKPSKFKASWYRALAILGLRRNSVGGFGSFIPETSAAG